MNRERLHEIFSDLKNLSIGVLGDFALDFYYQLNTETGEESLETNKSVFHASEPRPVPGGAGTIVNNLIALGVGDVRCFGMVGNDLFGRELCYLLEQKGANTQGILQAGKGWETYVYSKPHVNGIESNRIDFGSKNPHSPHDFQQIQGFLSETLPRLDVLILNQQFENGLTSVENLTSLKNILEAFPLCFVISDLRDSSGAFHYGVLKGNISEINRIGKAFDDLKAHSLMEIAKKAHLHSQSPILMTAGEKGLVYIDQHQSHKVAGIPLKGPLDITGAGDACLAAFSACMGIKIAIPEAMDIANLAAAVSVQKLRETGSASPDEIRALAANYPYR
ncbi:MAG: PfkB family carbohydrate kinase [Bacteroidia bacterium]|nr:PfkB family carbohydrate kinase [Bacteroidia bacterium]